MSVPLGRVYRFELRKLLAGWPVRLVLLGCWLVPGLVVAGVTAQSALPGDTVFGRWMAQSGWASPLVVLTMSGTWVLPLVTSLVAGDVFAVEDRLGTWRHLLIAVRSPGRIFAAKASASLTVIGALALGLAVSSTVGGLVAVGHQPLVGLDGHALGSGAALGRILLAWLSVLAPTLAFAGVGLLGSVALGRSALGLAIPALLALGLQIVALLPVPVAVRVVLPSDAFTAWRGLLTAPAQLDTLWIGVAVSLLWALVALALARRLFVRRDFTDLGYEGSWRSVGLGAVLPLGALLAGCVAVVLAAAPSSGSGIDAAKLRRSLAIGFAHLYRRQTAELHRPAVTEAELHSRATCQKGGGLVADTGAGNDWRCVVSWQLPGSTAVGSTIYQLDVKPDGRYVADGDGPPQVNGFFQVRTAVGIVPNPLWQFDGLIDLLAAAPGH